MSLLSPQSFSLPSLLSTAAFLAILAIVVGMVCFFHVVSRSDSVRRNAAMRNVVAVVTLWLAVSSLFVLAGHAGAVALTVQFFLFIAVIAGTVGLAFSSYGRRIAFGVTVPMLVGVHAFRLPLELLLHQWWHAGFVPVQMTFAGDNFDIAAGILAIGVGGVAWRYPAHRYRATHGLVWAFNIVAFLLLLRILVIVNLSNPTPLASLFGGYPAGQEMRATLYFPYVWLATVIVPVALFLHIVLFRRLAAGLNGRAHSGPASAKAGGPDRVSAG